MVARVGAGGVSEAGDWCNVTNDVRDMRNDVAFQFNFPFCRAQDSTLTHCSLSCIPITTCSVV